MEASIRPVRVLVVDHSASRSGAEAALARLLAVVDRDRVDPRVLLLEDGPLVGMLRDDGVPVAVLPASRRLLDTGRGSLAASPAALARNVARTAALVPRIARAVRGSRAELVVANSLKSAVLLALAAPLAGRPWVWHLHDRLAPDYLPARTVRAMRALALRGPRAVIVNSRATRDTLPPTAQRRAAIAYPGIDVEAWPSAAHRPPRHPVFGLVGRIAPTKGQREFLEAAARTRESLPDAAFRIVGAALFGDAGYAEEVRALGIRLGIADRVAFVGWADPRLELAALTVAVHASPVPEPFGQVVVEAMLAGVPVIATRAGGIPEILDPNRDAREVAAGVAVSHLGILVAPGDPGALARAMEWAVRHRGELVRVAAAARPSAAARFGIRESARIVEREWLRAARRTRSAPR